MINAIKIKIACAFLICVTINFVFAQTLILHEWKVTVKVVDENGRPIPNVKTDVGYFSKSQPASIDGLTDANGVFRTSHSANSGLLGFSAEKTGYYTTRLPSYDLGFNYDPEKWIFTETIVLKKIGKPIPMYARNVQVEIPEINKPIGFDLIENDWVAPYGKGKQSDLIFTVQRRWVSRYDFDCALKITFTNSGDGLVPVTIPLNQGSELRMTTVAPLEGYLSEISKNLSHTPANGWITNDKHDKGYGNDEEREQNYYLRIRSMLSEQSQTKSALYGKIYNDFALDPINSKTTFIIFTYYLNPETNSRNVEFNPKQNLSKDLKPGQNVSAP